MSPQKISNINSKHEKNPSNANQIKKLSIKYIDKNSPYLSSTIWIIFFCKEILRIKDFKNKTF